MKFSDIRWEIAGTPVQQSQPAPSGSSDFPDKKLARAPDSPTSGHDLARFASTSWTAEKAYGRGIKAMKQALNQIQITPIQAYGELRQIAEEFLELLRSEAGQALLALTTRSTPDNYLYAHSVNVAILSLRVGLGLHGLPNLDLSVQDREQLVLLGVAALLHDIGMSKWVALTREPRPLTTSEQLEISLHPIEGAKLLDNILDIQESLKPLLAAIIAQKNEKFEFMGNAANLGSNSSKDKRSVHQGPQIIGLCGVYEAMTHYRSWREPHLPHEMIKRMINEYRYQFDEQVFKIFVQQLSFYPPGSFAQLSNGEIARVVRVNPHAPTAPTVEILLTNTGRRQAEPLLRNLAESPQIWIERAVDETKLDIEEKELLQLLRQKRWWMEI